MSRKCKTIKDFTRLRVYLLKFKAGCLLILCFDHLVTPGAEGQLVQDSCSE